MNGRKLTFLKPLIPRWDGDRTILPALSLGIFFLNILFFTIVLSTMALIMGGAISAAYFPMAIFFSLLFNYFFFRQETKQFLGIMAIAMVILAICILLTGYVHDWSCDGNTYHKGITGALCWGWNPFREDYFKFSNRFDFLRCYDSPWLDAYAKSSELYGACVYALTGNIETGKSYNLLAIFSLFFIAYGILLDTKLLKPWQGFICACFFALNPVSFSQIFTFYNDAFLGVMLFICLIGLLYITFYTKLISFNAYLIFVSINIGFNIKTSSIIFFAMLCLTFFAFWVWQKYRKALSELWWRFWLLAASVLSGVLFLGSSTYIINTIRYKNPLYPMVGPGSADILSDNLPQVYLTMSKFSQFFASLFSQASNTVQVETVNWKFPFTFTKNEFRIASVYDVRTGGWGILFSGIFILSICVIIWILWKLRNKRRDLFSLSLALSVMMVLAIAFIPGLCWARYFTSLFCVPVAALLFLFVLDNKHKDLKKRILALALSTLLFANMLPNVKRSLSLMKHADETWVQLSELKALSKTNEIRLGYGVGEFPYVGRFFNVIDEGITDFEYDLVDPEEATGKLFGNYSIYYQITED